MIKVGADTRIIEFRLGESTRGTWRTPLVLEMNYDLAKDKERYVLRYDRHGRSLFTGDNIHQIIDWMNEYRVLRYYKDIEYILSADDITLITAYLKDFVNRRGVMIEIGEDNERIEDEENNEVIDNDLGNSQITSITSVAKSNNYETTATTTNKDNKNALYY
jgi:hypothetical protein